MNHRYLTFEELVLEQLYYQSRLLRRIYTYLERVMNELLNLKAAVAAERTVVNSAITLLGGIKAALDEAIESEDPAALRALSDELGRQTTDLSNAVLNNTPVPPVNFEIISASPLANAKVGEVYSQEFDATGGARPFARWSSSAGTPPFWATFNAATGVLSGTPPSQEGSPFEFTIDVVDNAGAVATKDFTLTVDA